MKIFLWGYNKDHSKIQWVQWDQLGLSKDSGELGFRDLKRFNLAMLAKKKKKIGELYRILSHSLHISSNRNTS